MKCWIDFILFRDIKFFLWLSDEFPGKCPCSDFAIKNVAHLTIHIFALNSTDDDKIKFLQPQIRPIQFN